MSHTQGGTAQGGTARVDPREFLATAELRDIKFSFDRYDIRPEDVGVLDANAEALKSHPNWLVLIEGHADERGTTEYNVTLGDRRARASMNYLISRGVRSSRISIISYGEERPLCAESTEGCWSRNRRAHFMVKGR